MRYAYYPGCLTRRGAKELDDSTRLVCARLGVELEELPAAPCCGAGDVQAVSPALGSALSALVLAQAEKTGLDVLTVCNVCTLSLRQAASLWTSDEDDAAVLDAGGPTAASRQAAADALAAAGHQYTGGVAVTHLLWVLWREVGAGRLGDAVTRRLDGIRLAPFYGCQILRPSTLNPEADADDPSALEDLLAACGAEPLDYDGRLKCCGWPVMFSRQQTASAVAARAVLAAKNAGADALVTPCPLCHQSLDGCQSDAEHQVGEPLSVPVLHLPQALGLALGFGAEELGLHRHLTSVKRLLARLDPPAA
jgi:succinate dehydrogenase / fumarate reductase, cytochrome b subunit